MSLRLPREQEQDPEIVSPLLKLPAELRCIIYSYALGVPKWNRRHDFDCSYPEDALPPFRTLPERHDSRIPLRELESKDMHECSKNLGLPLLRTCKQIHNEALEYLWEKGPGFCFGDADSFVRAVRELPKALRTKVKKVSIMDFDSGYWRVNVWDEKAGSLLTALGSLPNLHELEVPACYAVAEPLSILRNLTSLRILQPTIEMEDGRPVFLSLCKTYAVPASSTRTRRQFFHDLEGEVWELWHASVVAEAVNAKRSWSLAAVGKLRREGATLGDGGMLTTDVELKGLGKVTVVNVIDGREMMVDLKGLGTTEVRVWGMIARPLDFKRFVQQWRFVGIP